MESKIIWRFWCRIRLGIKIFEKDFFLRIDKPIYLYDDNAKGDFNKKGWVFSFKIAYKLANFLSGKT